MDRLMSDDEMIDEGMIDFCTTLRMKCVYFCSSSCVCVAATD